MPRITVIPQTVNPQTRLSAIEVVKRKVTGYARVSTDLEEQITSYQAQRKYYTEYIQKNPDWEFAGMYTDEGISATSTRHREGFNQMIKDALDGKIDLIITKSVSRFARNTVDSLTTIRKLKENNVECYFEKENIWTFQSSSESRKWQIRKDFSNGKIGSITILGYRRNADGILEIEPKEAELVRMIFSDYISGMGQQRIANKINEMGIPTRQGNLWTHPRIREILTNEKYIGNLLLQKYYRNNHIEKIKTKNQGELARYYVEQAHEPIVDFDTFIKVQTILDQRHEQYTHDGSTNRYPLSGLITCGLCGKNYQRKQLPQGIIWLCATFLRRGKKYCPGSKQIPESILYSLICDILKLTEFDEVVFRDNIHHIVIPKPFEVQFFFHDGTSEIRHWEYPSRSESWTEEMKQAARERSRKWNEKLP